MRDLITLAQQLVKTLTKSQLYITTVESCTGGGIANSITNVAGSSEVFLGARVTYSNKEKIALGVSEEIIKEFGVYSLETAEAMAKAGLESAVRADISIGITGSITRVDPTNPNSKPGEVYIAVVFGNHTLTEKFTFTDSGERSEVKDRAINEALKMTIEILQKKP